MIRTFARWASRRLFDFSAKLARRFHPELNPRSWSNASLRRVCAQFEGDVVNVSGWLDEDRQGGHYADYFRRKRSYAVTNYPGERGFTGAPGEILLDLTKSLPNELVRRFDTVFNHTTLEHVYDIRTAVATMCAMSRDIVVLVVPFIQQVHVVAGSFLDFWRPTPFALKRMFEENGLSVLHVSANDNPLFAVYVMIVASRQPEHWTKAFAEEEGLDFHPGRCFAQSTFRPRREESEVSEADPERSRGLAPAAIP